MRLLASYLFGILFAVAVSMATMQLIHHALANTTAALEGRL